MDVPVIGLVGGIGSGKSALAGWLSDRRNLIVVDADATAHTILKEQTVKDHIRERFGAGVFDPAGEVNRASLGRVVFGSSADRRSARAELEQIVHWRIRESLIQQIAEARATGVMEAILLDAAVLFEAGWDDLCDAVVFVDASDEVRRQRVEQARGWSEADLKPREASQMELAVKRSKSDDTVDNSGKLAEAGDQLERVLKEILQQNS